MSYVKFHPVSETHGFAVEKMQKSWNVVYVRRENEKLIKEGSSRSNGRLLSFSSPFLADFVIRTEILPLYKKEIA